MQLCQRRRRSAHERPRVVIVGLGDAGLLAATQLADFEVVGVTPKPCHHSQQEVGGRAGAPQALAAALLPALQRLQEVGWGSRCPRCGDFAGSRDRANAKSTAWRFHPARGWQRCAGGV